MVGIPSRNLTKSNAQFQRAVKRLPLGVASTFRYWGDERTIYVHHGKGGRTWDIDGNAYVDYRLERDAEKWLPVFRINHATTRNL